MFLPVEKLILQFGLGPPEILLIIFIIILLIWGPQQLPKLARSLGLAKREFQKAQQDEIEEEESSKKEDEITKLAKELGIETSGKSREEIIKEIAKRVKKE